MDNVRDGEGRLEQRPVRLHNPHRAVERRPAHGPDIRLRLAPAHDPPGHMRGDLQVRVRLVGKIAVLRVAGVGSRWSTDAGELELWSDEDLRADYTGKAA